MKLSEEIRNELEIMCEYGKHMISKAESVEEKEKICNDTMNQLSGALRMIRVFDTLSNHVLYYASENKIQEESRIMKAMVQKARTEALAKMECEIDLDKYYGRFS